MDPEEAIFEVEEAMSKCVDYLMHEFAGVRTGKASPAPPSAGGGASWTVQVAALRSEADAARLSEELRRKGFAARIEMVDLPDKGLWFRVRAGAFAFTAVIASACGADRQDT